MMKSNIYIYIYILNFRKRYCLMHVILYYGALTCNYNAQTFDSYTGLQQILTSHVFSQALCTEKSSEAEIIVCVTDTVTNISRLIQTGVAVLTLNFRVLVGGRYVAKLRVFSYSSGWQRKRWLG